MGQNNYTLSRREFVKQTVGAVSAFTIVPRYVLGGVGHVPPSEKINIAVIGCGGQGRSNTRQLLQAEDAQVVAVADPRDSADYKRFYYKGVAGRLPVKKEIEDHYQAANPKFKCNDYKDFRVMFDKEKNIDAVLCATPDHWHAPGAIMALIGGKARQLAKVAEERKVATQMGNQGRSSVGHPSMCEWVRDGAIGTIREVWAWSSASQKITHPGRPQETMTEPEGFDWKLWVGPREMRPYSLEYAPYTWRSWWTFGSGTVGDMAIHNLDSSWVALQLGMPTWIEGKNAWLDSEVSAPNNEVVWMFEETDTRPAIKFVWRDGTLTFNPPEELEENRKMGGNGVLVIGDKGKILGGGWSGSPRIIPETKMREYQRPPKTLPRSKGHHRNWLDACKNGGPTVSNFEYGARLTEFILLGNLAIRAGKRIYWDDANMKVKDMPELDSLIREVYTPEWDLNNI